MDNDNSLEILAELRKLRRLTKRGIIGFLVLIAVVVVGSFLPGPSRNGVYGDVNKALGEGDYHRATQLAEKLASEHPQDYYVLEYLGNVYLRAGDFVKAEEAYSRSNALLPSEEIQKTLDAIRKHRSTQDETPTGSPIGTPSAPTP